VHQFGFNTCIYIDIHGQQNKTWKNNIDMDLQQIRCESVGRIRVKWDTDTWPAHMNKAVNFGFNKILSISKLVAKTLAIRRKLLNEISFKN
jgi:hypothetical protein